MLVLDFYDFMKCTKTIDLPLYLLPKTDFFLQKTAYCPQVGAQLLTTEETEKVRHYALKIQHLVQKGWCNESASIIECKCNEFFIRGSPEKLKDFTPKSQVNPTSTVMQLFINFILWLNLLMLSILRIEKFAVFF